MCRYRIWNVEYVIGNRAEIEIGDGIGKELGRGRTSAFEKLMELKMGYHLQL